MFTIVCKHEQNQFCSNRIRETTIISPKLFSQKSAEECNRDGRICQNFKKKNVNLLIRANWHCFFLCHLLRKARLGWSKTYYFNYAKYSTKASRDTFRRYIFSMGINPLNANLGSRTNYISVMCNCQCWF